MIHLTGEQQEELTRITQSRTSSVASVQRANVLLKYAQGQRISRIAQDMETNRPLVERCIDRALTFGPLQGLRDIPRPRMSSQDYRGSKGMGFVAGMQQTN